jgi:hypothetical protein
VADLKVRPKSENQISGDNEEFMCNKCLMFFPATNKGSSFLSHILLLFSVDKE